MDKSVTQTFQRCLGMDETPDRLHETYTRAKLMADRLDTGLTGEEFIFLSLLGDATLKSPTPARKRRTSPCPRAAGGKTCPRCGKQFVPSRSDAKYCGVACKQSVYRKALRIKASKTT